MADTNRTLNQSITATDLMYPTYGFESARGMSSSGNNNSGDLLLKQESRHSKTSAKTRPTSTASEEAGDVEMGNLAAA